MLLYFCLQFHKCKIISFLWVDIDKDLLEILSNLLKNICRLQEESSKYKIYYIYMKTNVYYTFIKANVRSTLVIPILTFGSTIHLSIQSQLD